jgi:cytoskeletal protein CcmA (bactofilin family)
MAQLLSGTRIYGNTSIDSQLIVGNVTSWQATSNSTGSLIISGGVGITGNVYTGNIVITGITSNGITFADGTRQTTATATGAFLSNTSTLLTVNSASQILITNTTTSTSNTTGALVVKGGVGIQGNVYADGLFVSGSSVLNTLTTANANISLLFAIDNYQNTIISVIQGTDTSQNTRIDYSNAVITIIQGVDTGQNANIALVQTLANTDFTNVSITTTTSSSNGLYIPVITVAANGRVTAISNTLITGGGSSAGYLANSVIFANTTGYLSNTANIAFYTSNNTLVINGTLAATSKSFSINHPTKPNTQLRYGSLEGPENGVYVRGVLNGNVIELPEYWTKLVDAKTITVQLTPIEKHQKLYVEKVEDNCVFVGVDGWFKNNISCYYIVYAERADIEKLVVEI